MTSRMRNAWWWLCWQAQRVLTGLGWIWIVSLGGAVYVWSLVWIWVWGLWGVDRLVDLWWGLTQGGSQ